MLCVAASFVLANQTYIAFMDQAEHAAHREHAPNALAGTVHLDHDHGDHDHLDGAPHEGDADEEKDGTLAHHHSDTTVLFLASAFVGLELCLLPESPSNARANDQAGLGPRGLDHPPKRRLEIRI